MRKKLLNYFLKKNSALLYSAFFLVLLLGVFTYYLELSEVITAISFIIFNVAHVFLWSLFTWGVNYKLINDINSLNTHEISIKVEEKKILKRYTPSMTPADLFSGLNGRINMYTLFLEGNIKYEVSEEMYNQIELGEARLVLSKKAGITFYFKQGQNKWTYEEIMTYKTN